ncbi:MAG: hypothetical protein KC933_02670 [Myxococcales bacterium]|nr:hypothetical protein [Myxococcales bacterium]
MPGLFHGPARGGNITPVRWSGLWLVGALLWAIPARAHTFEHPKTLRLGVRGDRMFLAVNFDVNPGQEALRTRALFDRDSDGALSQPEQTLLEGALERMARLWLKARVDGAEVQWTRRELVPNRLDRPADDDQTLGLALLYEAPVPPQGFELVLEDRDRDAAKHVPLEVDLGEGWSVVLASQGELWPEARQVRGVQLKAGRQLILRLKRNPG